MYVLYLKQFRKICFAEGMTYVAVLLLGEMLNSTSLNPRLRYTYV